MPEIEEGKDLKNEAKKNDDVVSKADLEALQAELNKTKMSESQARNALKEKEEAEAKVKAELEKLKNKKGEDDDEVKQLLEQERQKREELESRIETSEKQKKLTETQNGLFEEFPSDVVELAQETGLSLNDTSEDAVKEFRGKLEKIQEKVGNGGRIGPNNPGPGSSNQEERKTRLEQLRSRDPEQIRKAVESIPLVQTLGNINQR